MSIVIVYCQIWIAQQVESPRLKQLDPSSLGDLVNWTMNYRRDSTIPSPYGFVTKRRASVTETETSNPPEPTIDYASGKTQKVAWFVSNCKVTTNGRRNYANELNK